MCFSAITINVSTLLTSVLLALSLTFVYDSPNTYAADFGSTPRVGSRSRSRFSSKSRSLIQTKGKSKVGSHQCSYSGIAWNKQIHQFDTLFPTFIGWLSTLTQEYIHVFPVDKSTVNSVRTVKEVLFSVVKPTPFRSKIKLAALSYDALVEFLNLNPTVAKTSLFLDFISGQDNSFFPPALAHRYGGHQFGYWSGQLGDGRAVLLGTFQNSHGNMMELNLKGSGLTPYSRQGDGRAVLRSSVREFLASEAMHYLGVPTSRALSLIVSDDPVIRDEFYNGQMREEHGAMVVRVAPSWFRIGSLEILSHNGEIQLLQSLLDYVIERHYRHIDFYHSDRYLMLFEEIVRGTAHLIAAWQSLGFTHGVCNTDNFSLLSITLDYGPFGFLEQYDEGFVPNTSDDEGRYSYGKQPSVGYYNLDMLRIALDSVLSNSQQRTAKLILNGYYDILNQTLLEQFTKKLGLHTAYSTANSHLIKMFLKMMKQTGSDFTMSFRQLGEANLEDLRHKVIDNSHWALKQLSSHPKFEIFLKKYNAQLRAANISETDRKRRMCEINPAYVLRNWMAHAAIRQAEQDDFSKVRQLLHVLQQPFTRQVEAEQAGYSSRPPSWAANIKVSCSS